MKLSINGKLFEFTGTQADLLFEVLQGIQDNANMRRSLVMVAGAKYINEQRNRDYPNSIVKNYDLLIDEYNNLIERVRFLIESDGQKEFDHLLNSLRQK